MISLFTSIININHYHLFPYINYYSLLIQSIQTQLAQIIYKYKMNPAESSLLNINAKNRFNQDIADIHRRILEGKRNLFIKDMNKSELRLMNDRQFLSHYKQAKFIWIIKSDKQATESIISISNSSILQYSKEAKRYLKLQCKIHDGVLIQSYIEYKLMMQGLKQLDCDIKLVQNQIKQNIIKLTEEQVKQKTLEMESIKKQINNDFYPFSHPWNQVASIQQNQEALISRIIIYSDPKIEKEKNYYIYNNEMNQQPQPPNPTSHKKQLLPHQDSKEAHRLLEILRIHLILQKNENLTNKIKFDFKKKIDSILINQFQSFEHSKAMAKKNLLENKELASDFVRYEKAITSKFIDGWKFKVGQHKNKKDLYVEVGQILITNDVMPQFLELYISNGQKIQYKYHGINKNYLSFTINDKIKQASYFTYNLNSQKDAFMLKIQFKVKAIFNDKEEVVFENKFIKYLEDKEVDHCFTEELLLQYKGNNKKDNLKKDINCLIYFDQQVVTSFFASSPSMYYTTKIFKHIGEVPNKFGSHLNIKYTPHTFKMINQLLFSNHSSKISKESYQNTYYHLVKFIQAQENQSQSNIMLSKSKIRTNKWLMVERFQAYQKRLLETLGFINKQPNFQAFYKNNNQKVAENIAKHGKISVNSIDYKNAMEDLKLCKPKNYLLVRDAIIKYVYLSNNIQKSQQFAFSYRYTSHLIPIFERLIDLYQRKFQEEIRSSVVQGIHDHLNRTEIFVYFAFIGQLYPYSDYNNFKSDLYILRWLVQKKLSFYNDYLNRNHIGLENVIAPYLLTMFTQLSSELTYRIWDYLIASEQRDKARIIIAFTLLTYLQTTENLPIIPIDTFMHDVESNMKAISVQKEFASKFAQIADKYFINESKKQKRLERIFVKNADASVIQDRILHRIILGQPKLKIPHEDQGKIPYSKTNHIAKENDITLKQLPYPLPEPNYHGHPIISIIMFLHDVNILENINLNTNKYWIKLYIPKDSNHQSEQTLWSEYVPIIQKNYYYNKAIVIGGEYFNIAFLNDKSKQGLQGFERSIRISIILKEKETEKHLMRGSLDYSLFYKDRAYKTHVCLVPATLHNKGTTILNMSLCLKSVKYDKKNHQHDYTSLQMLSQKLLDYDIGQSNESIVGLKRLRDNYQRMKFPLDQFSQNHYKRILNKGLNLSQPQFIESSSVSIEQLKAIFYNVFHQEKDKFIKHQFSKYYEIFGEEYNLQQVYFSQILIKLVIMANLSRKKKLMYLYCVAVHYQNAYSKKINAQTLNSLIRLIYKQYSHLNACPYELSTCGKIVQAYYFQSSVKTKELKKDFTQIMQDLAYICQFKFGYADIILGSAKDLSILRTLFDIKTLQKIQQQVQCRFQIIYDISGLKFLWTAVIDPKTFQILKRGTKFLNNFAQYSNIKYLDSSQQLLLNCENMIPLQVNRSYNYEQFTSLMNHNPVMRYLLDTSIINKTIYKKQYTDVNLLQKINAQRESQEDAQQDEYKNWVVFRGQNCLQTWRRCKIENYEKVISKISFESGDKSRFCGNVGCLVNSIDILSMEEIKIEQIRK